MTLSSADHEDLMNQVAALDNLARHATRTIRFDEAADLYIVQKKATGEVIGHYETYREAREAGH